MNQPSVSEAKPLSVTRHRLFLGGLAFALPVVLYFGHIIQSCVTSCDLEVILPRGSLSSYYYTGMRDIFVGIIIAWGVFLFTYNGLPKNKDDTRKLSEYWTSTLASAGAFGLALFPTTPSEEETVTVMSILSPLSPTILGVLHYIFTAIFFLSLTYMANRLFTRSGSSIQVKTYRFSGYIMTGSFILITINFFLEYIGIVVFPYTLFVLEVVAIFAFGTSWVVKSREKSELQMNNKT